MIRSRVEPRREEVVAENGVAATGHELAAAAGIEIMRQGGNAIDAGVAAAFVSQLAEPGMCGLGGNGIILVHEAGSSKTTLFDDSTVAPAAATADMFEVLPGSGGFYGWDNVRDDANLFGHTSVAIPGTVAGLCAAHERYGALSLKDVMAPAIDLAQAGFAVDSYTTVTIAQHMDNFGRFPRLGSMMLIDGHPPTPGTFWSEGDRLRWPELADSYRAIAEGGHDGFYKGRIARATEADMEANGGILTYDDLATYESDVRDLDPTAFSEYRGVRYAPGGSNLLAQVLNILERFDLAGMGSDSAAYRHVMLETMRRAYVNYSAFPREPGLATKEYAEVVAGLIDLDRTSPEYSPLEPWPYQEGAAYPGPAAGSPMASGGHTTTLATADRNGNIMNILTSLGNVFGSYVVVPGTGIILNDHMCNFDPVPGRPLSLGASRRTPPGPHVPMFFREGKPFLAVDAPGARRSMSGVIHTIVHCIEFEMGVQEAIEVPRVWAEAIHAGSFLDSRIPDGVQRRLAAMGHDIVPMDVARVGGFGRPTAVLIDMEGRLHAGADPMYDTGVTGF